MINIGWVRTIKIAGLDFTTTEECDQIIKMLFNFFRKAKKERNGYMTNSKKKTGCFFN